MSALDGFAWDWYALDQMRRMRLRAMTDQQLNDLAEEVQGVTNTNCWYAAYRAAQGLPDAIKEERYFRANNSRASHLTEGD